MRRSCNQPPQEAAIPQQTVIPNGVKELYFALFDQQTLSRRMVALLTARADRLIDAVRDRGISGYEETVHSFAFPSPGFRIALWLHRMLGFELARSPAYIAE